MERLVELNETELGAVAGGEDSPELAHEKRLGRVPVDFEPGVPTE